MKKLYATTLLILAFCFCKAQYVLIPGDFAGWLTANTILSGCTYTDSLQNVYLDTTCSAVLNKTKIDCSNWPSCQYCLRLTDLTGVQYFKNLDTLICSQNYLQSLPTLPATLRYFDCSENGGIDSFPPYLPAGLLYLNCEEVLGCSGECPTKLPKAWPTGLQYLNCSQMMNDSFPALPSTLTFFDCSSSFAILTQLPSLPAGLTSLNCGFNSIVNLPTLPAPLTNLQCNNNKLTSLPALPPALLRMDCSYNQINSIPSLPTSLISLACDSNLLTSLPTLPASLDSLSCGSNKLVALPALPSAINTLECNFNKLTSLPTFSSLLSYLDCGHNQLTSLPAIPSILWYLDCGYNQLTNLPELTHSISVLVCCYNNIANLPALPDSMYWLWVNNNPRIRCLPPVKVLQAFSYQIPLDISGTGIMCLPNVISHPYQASFPPIDTMPICNIFNNPYGCAQTWNIQGNTYFDTFNNCDTTISEPGLGSIKMLLFDSTGNNLLQQVITNGNGSYSFNTSLGKFVVKTDTTGTPFYVLCPDTNAHHSNLTVSDSLDYYSNFRVACKNGYDLAVTSVNYANDLFFPGRSATVNISAGDLATYYGANCNTGDLRGLWRHR